MKHLNFTLTNLLSQVESQKNPIIPHENRKKPHSRYTKLLHEDIWNQQELRPFDLENELVHWIINQNPTVRKLINDLMYLYSQGIKITISQTRMGNKIDRSLVHTHRLIRHLKQNRIADTYTRGRDMTAITRLTPMLARPSIWEKLQDILPICKSLTKGFILFAGLMSTPKTLAKWANDVESKRDIYKYNNKDKKHIVSSNSVAKNTPKTEPPKVAASHSEAKSIIDAFLATLG